jgi:hypothetical protein
MTSVSLSRPPVQAAVLLLLAVGTASAQPVALPNQGSSAPAIPVAPSTTPPGNDTTGYWQQRADYTIVATLDERANAVHANGTLRYVNRSPDTLRELWVHQHLNAFRPGSRWAKTDEREGRNRFQRMDDPHYAYERFTAPVQIDGTAVTAGYPLAPDSTVVRFALPRPLAPGDSITVQFAWDARPSTLPRRQGRRDRSYDFAQWYPKVAVYDRSGWRPNALVPAGEFYGEFGTFDVTFILPDDQTIGATGVPVSGDPGWARARRPGTMEPRLAAHAYGTLPPAPTTPVPAGSRAVRFVARNVHHFAWSVSPGFRYEGAVYVRAPRSQWRFPIWDTVSVHALYRADAASDCARANASAEAARRAALERTCIETSLTQWENGRALRFGLEALTWLEQVYGDYPYPQMTMLKRLDGGGTEFPMMMQNGSASLGLTLHEGGHIYAYGILANNEWQSGWLDEGHTSYQSAMHGGTVRPLVAARLAAANDRNPAAPRDTALARMRAALDRTAQTHAGMVTDGSMQPIGTRGDLFANFGVYNNAVYGRAQLMYQALHDVLGDDAFRAFLRDYFARWQFRHVDRWAMQGAAERAHGAALDWFFDQWVNEVGNIDYTLRSPVVSRRDSGYVTTVRLDRTGAYRHPMPVGVRTAAGWTIVRAQHEPASQLLTIHTSQRPDAVWLDPFGATDSPGSRHYRLSLTAPQR